MATFRIILTLSVLFLKLTILLGVSEGSEIKCKPFDDSSDALLYSQYCSNEKTLNTENPKYSQNIIDKAAQEGRIKVIVKLKGDFIPEGLLGDNKMKTTQRYNIKSQQDALLNKIDSNGLTNIK
ncbi:MAG: hypothetical protein SNJ53_01535, partial [Thermodesulfovibrionales bacterium]